MTAFYTAWQITTGQPRHLVFSGPDLERVQRAVPEVPFWTEGPNLADATVDVKRTWHAPSLTGEPPYVIEEVDL